MTTIRPYCLVSGRNFSPDKLTKSTGIYVRMPIEVGEIGTSGRYKGKMTMFGSGIIEPGNDCNVEPSECLINLISMHIEAIREAGAEEMTIYFNVEYTDQCNVEFDSQFLRRIADLNIPLALTCYSVFSQLDK